MAMPIVAGSTEPVPLPSPLQCIPALRSKLDQAHLCIDRLNQVTHLAAYSLREERCDADASGIACLAPAVTTEIEAARSAFQEALEQLQLFADACRSVPAQGVAHG